MRYTMQMIAAVLLLMLGAQAWAQLEVRLDVPRKEHILGEDVTVKITIVNHTDASIALTNTPGRSWLHLDVSRRGEMAPERATAIPRYPDLTITPGSRRAYNIQLKPHYNLSREGIYHVIATLRLPDMSTTYSSNVATFNLTSGGSMRSFVIQARGQKLQSSIKLLSWKGDTYLFGQVMNMDTRQAVGACYLGKFLNFMQPKVLLDRAQNLHVLCQSAPDYYTYAVMDTFGARREAKLMKRTSGPIDLISTGGGIRCIGVAPYTKPKPDAQLHSATERP